MKGQDYCCRDGRHRIDQHRPPGRQQNRDRRHQRQHEESARYTAGSVALISKIWSLEKLRGRNNEATDTGSKAGERED